MIIWLAMAIPFGTWAILYLKYRRHMMWWEFLIPLAASALLIGISKYCTEATQIHDTEWWGGWVVNAQYDERWDEEVPCTHAKYRTEPDGKGGTREVFDGYEHTYDVDDHPAEWRAFDSNGIRLGIGQDIFKRLVHQFGNRQFIDMNRDYHSQDGDRYETIWPHTEDSLEPVTTVHRWTNRIQGSDSVFNYRKVNPKTYNLFNYPKVSGYTCQGILGDGGPTQRAAERQIQLLNALLGASKKVRVWILVFKDKSSQASVEQECYWKGGNKNEFIVTIGVDRAYNVKWARSISWTSASSLKTDAKVFVQSQQKLDLVALVRWLKPQIQDRYVHNSFKQFDYLTVDPPMW
ncbi:MAG: hypothetical protein HW405_599, partial [Candidatus Berkelbacteria bacterium]|nr:hypothetical protein [Candidatus Berkelbacteria bacterium]